MALPPIDTMSANDEQFDGLPSAPDGNCLIIALDFGTTFSGLAYGFTGGDKPETYSIKEWPGLEGHEQPKVETLISYNKDSGLEWGAQARDKNPLVGIKLLLDPEQERPMFIPGGVDSSGLEAVGKSAEQVASDYIGALFRHGVAMIEGKYPRDYLKGCRRKYVVTVPAVWSDKAKNATLKAARMAGMHPVEVVTEPEAAALYTLFDMQDRALEVGDAFVICDAGGGTVDLISYELMALSPRMELKELVPSKGGMAGSLVLNNRFEDAVQKLVGKEEFFALEKKTGWRQGLDDFDLNVKRAFRGDDKEFLVAFPRANLPDNPKKNLEDNSWLMTKETLEQIFSPVVTEIEKLVAEQVDKIRVKRLESRHPKGKSIKAIFLVGGFGSNKYLKQRLEEKHPDIQVIQPNNAWGAIANGAVLSQMPTQVAVTSSVATRHYGVAADELYIPHMDGGQPKRYDGCTGQYRCTKMTWYIQTGDDLSRCSTIKFPFYRDLEEPISNDSLIFTSAISISEKVAAPRYPGDGTAIYVKTTSDLTQVDRSLFTRVTGKDGKKYTRVDFELTLIPKSGLFRFACELNGQEYGSVEANYA